MGRYEQIQSVTFPDTAIAIWSGACMHFTNLTDVTIPEGVKTIGANAFQGCLSLKSLTIPVSVTYMENISDNPDIVYHVQKGSAADRCLTAEGKKVVRTGTKVPVTGITIEGEAQCRKTVSFDQRSENRTICIEAEIAPLDATDRQIYWSVDHPGILGLDESFILNSGQKVFVDVIKGGHATITAKTADGEFTAQCSVEAQVDLSCHEISLEKDTFEYDGTEKRPSVIIQNLKEGDDYSVEYRNNVEEGTGTVIITGIGGNTGSVTREFTIKAKKTEGNKKPGGSTPPYITPVRKPGSSVFQYAVSVKKPAGLKVKNIRKKKAKITWKKVSGVSGYEIYRSTSRYGNYKKIKTVRSTSYTNGRLKKERKYYYKICAYKVIDGIVYRSTFTGMKGVRIKK